MVDGFLPRPYRVRSRKRETSDVVTLSLEPEDGRPSAFSPGQFNMVYAFGVGEVPISISGDGAHPRVLAHTIREVGTVTRALCRARKGDVVGIRGPFGTSWDLPRFEGRDAVIVAGGIGLAPLRPAIRELLARRDRFGRVCVLIGSRTPDDLLFRDDLARWRARFDVEVDVTVDAATPSWRGHVGVVTRLLPRAQFNPENAVALVCGPEVMMRFAASALLDLGVRPNDIRVSLERNMQCGMGMCGHCQLAPLVICRDGPVFDYDRVGPFVGVREL